MPDKTVEELSENIRQLRTELRDLKGQLGISQAGNQTIYQTLANKTLESPTTRGGTSTDGTYTTPVVTNPTISDLTLSDDKLLGTTGRTLTIPNVVDTLVAKTTTDVMTNKTLTAPVVNNTITLVDGANNTTISKTTDSDEVVFSNDIVVLTGKFAASTVEIGGQTLSEVGSALRASGNLNTLDSEIKSALTGAIGNATEYQAMECNLDPSSVGTTATIKGLNITNVGFDQSNDPNFYGIDITLDNPITSSGTYTALRARGDGNTVYIVDGSYAIHVDTGQVKFDDQVNFANGTTYKVEVDGDAVFKWVYADRFLLGDAESIIFGAGTDMFMNHSGVDGNLRCQTGRFFLDLVDRFIIRDKDDSYVYLWSWNSNERTMIVGNATDNIESKFYGVTSLGDGGTTNYAQFAADGELNLFGTAKVTKRVELANSILERGATAPTLTYIDNFIGWAYSINDDSVLTWAVPDDWDSSVGIIVEASWYINEAYASDTEVKWQCVYSLVPHDESELIDAPTHTGTLTGTSQNIPTLAKELTTTHIGTIPAGSIAAGDEIGLTFKRIAADNDDPTAEPVVIHLELEYTANKLGT